MPTDNPKISGYVPQQIYDRFKQYQQENNLSMSQAVILILAEYFGIEETIKENISGSPIGGVTLSEFQELKDRLKKVELEVEYLKSASNQVIQTDIDNVKDTIVEDDYRQSSLPLEFEVDYSEIDIELMGKDFAKRINLSSPKLSINKKQKTTDEFTEWTTQLDPDGIAWKYKTSNKGNVILYYPSEETNGELLSRLKKWIANNINEKI